jgi:predicted ATPase/serine phosphatase RsbU (regulator of sigma subunit)/tRNA A-37 threonylcarbamoyl transferase component Bud32
MLTLPNYHISTQIYESANSLVYRGVRVDDNQALIFKILKQDYPTPEELTRYKQEYEVTKSLDLEGVIKTYGIEKYQNTLVIILEDFGGEALKNHFDTALNISEFLKLAIQIAESLGQIHCAHVIHKDLNSANIVWNKKNDQLKIIDFGISSLLPRENPTLKNPALLEGTLAYISPEQTGRMNRALDYRTDLYSLGVTFYELLTGKLPYESTDSLELVHCHIAKTPVPVCKVNPNVPTIISNLVMKLMAKNAEDRYQSAFGLKFDLEQFAQNIQKYPSFNFELAQNDFSGQLQIPQKLYGRDAQREKLLNAFERVGKGNNEMMLVAGYSGIGKSVLVKEIYKSLTRGYFITGKFDQFQRNIPYSAFSTAFNEFCNMVLTESIEQLNGWREKILKAIGNNGQCLIDVIPHLELVIGPQAPLGDVGAQESLNRFNLVFQNFIQAISNPKHPLVLFIDDWQWADSASITLLKNLISQMDKQACLMICAFRDNEVDASHPFMMAVDFLKKAQITINQIQLSHLSHHHVNLLISETLKAQATEISLLSNLIYKKTLGNPFFTIEFLKSLYEEGLLVFDFKTRQWQWNIEKIIAKNLTDNVVELMANKINKLSRQSQIVLTLAASIGNTFDLKTLSIIAQYTPLETLTLVLKTLKEGLLLPLDDNYKDLENISLGESNPRFKFQHDRIEQAAYSLIADEDKQAIHLRIGRLLLANTSNSELEETLFEIVNQLNEGNQFIDDENEKRQLVELNLKAGKKAKEATAYAAACQYLKTGLYILGNEPLQKDYSLSFALYKTLIESLFLNSHFEESEKLIYATLSQVEAISEKIDLYYLLITQYVQIGQYEQAIVIGRKALPLLEINLPEGEEALQTALELELTEVKKRLAHEDINSLLAREEINHSKARLIINLLWKLMEASFGIGSETLLSFICVKVAHIGVEYHVPESTLGYCGYSYLLSFYGEYQTAYEFGLLSLKLSEKFNNLAHQCIACEGIADALIFWLKSLRSLDVFFEKGYQAGLESGTFSFTGYLACHYSLFLFYRGENIEKTIDKIAQFTPFATKNNHSMLMGTLLAVRLVLWNLSGRTAGKSDFHNEEITEAEYLAKSNEEDGIHLCFFHILKAQVFYLYEQPEHAYHSCLEAEKLLGYIAGMYSTTEHNFYHSLSLAALYPKVSIAQQQEYWQSLEANQKKMKNWAMNCPENFLHKYLLVEAEMACIAGKHFEAIDLYDRAIISARENEFIQNEALANELLAKFWLKQNKETYAIIHFKKAHHAYQLWGAKYKILYLEEKYPDFFLQKNAIPISVKSTVSITQLVSSSDNTASNWLDFNSFMKAAKTLSGEIVLRRLLEKMMHVVIENAGAETGFLLLPKQGEWFIEAEACIDSHQVNVLQSLSIEDQAIPKTIIYYVERTQENVLLNHASQDNPFFHDPYIIKYSPKSILCTPLVNQRELTGILYLENSLSTGVFTETQLEILKILSSQIAISIENALLYRTLEEKVEERTRQLAQANEKITALNAQLKSENVRMSAELEVSRQLQQMLLPKMEDFEQIKGLDIAGFMVPADEVGGDYYDVVQHVGHLFIAIGDVTGHGLESGALAIMVQSAVHTLIANNETNPVKFFSALNDMVFHNVQRMKVEKSLTLALVNYQDNQLYLSGQHEEIIVVREGKLELIDTVDLGFPIGLDEYIADFINQITVPFNRGDLVVLYTDGITEAENIDGVLYGLERLCEIIQAHWQKTAHEIQTAVIEDVRQFIGKQKVFDDMTLLVLKQAS